MHNSAIAATRLPKIGFSLLHPGCQSVSVAMTTDKLEKFSGAYVHADSIRKLFRTTMPTAPAVPKSVPRARVPGCPIQPHRLSRPAPPVAPMTGTQIGLTPTGVVQAMMRRGGSGSMDELLKARWETRKLQRSRPPCPAPRRPGPPAALLITPQRRAV